MTIEEKKRWNSMVYIWLNWSIDFVLQWTNKCRFVLSERICKANMNIFSRWIDDSMACTQTDTIHFIWYNIWKNRIDNIQHSFEFGWVLHIFAICYLSSLSISIYFCCYRRRVLLLAFFRLHLKSVWHKYGSVLRTRNGNQIEYSF